MCIEIDKYLKRPVQRERTAWKVINIRSTPTLWYPICRPGAFERGCWQKAKHRKYGFNCHTRRLKDGWFGKLVQVRIRGIEGYDRRGLVVFAREIFVPKPRVKRKEKPHETVNH